MFVECHESFPDTTGLEKTTLWNRVLGAGERGEGGERRGEGGEQERWEAGGEAGGGGGGGPLTNKTYVHMYMYNIHACTCIYTMTY